MSLSAAQIQGYAAAAGFSGADLATAVAVAFAESSGNPSAYNPEGSYGLWQIYMPAHPEFAGLDLTDPQTNANAAFSVYAAAGGRFTPWTTYKTGAYLAYLGAPIGTPIAVPPVSTTPVFTPSTSVMNLFPAGVPAPAPAFDWQTMGLALALLLGVGYALSEG